MRAMAASSPSTKPTAIAATESASDAPAPFNR